MPNESLDCLPDTNRPSFSVLEQPPKDAPEAPTEPQGQNGLSDRPPTGPSAYLKTVSALERIVQGQMKPTFPSVKDHAGPIDMVDAVLMLRQAETMMLKEITQHNEQADALTESRDMFAKIAAQIYGIVYQFRIFPDGRRAFLFIGRTQPDMFELDPDDVANDAGVVFNRIHPDDLPELFAAIEESAQTLLPCHCEFRVVLPRQGVCWRETHALPERMEGGGTLWHGIVSDISEQKKREMERKLLSMAVEQGAESVVITDAQGIIQYVNPVFETLTGYSREEAIGANTRILKSGRHDAAFYSEMWKTISSGKIWQGIIVNKKKDGKEFTESVTISPMLDASHAIINYVAVKRDMSYELSLKAQFDQAQKMESIGRLAGGVAHDFNNMLGVIIGRTEEAMEKMAADHPIFEDLQEIRIAANRSKNLTRQLLAFSRQQTISPKVLDLSETIAGMLKMLDRIIREDIQLAFLPGKDIWPIKFDPSQLDQVLINLCVNASDAMTGIGTITIETCNRLFDEDYCAAHAAFIPGSYVQLTVSDTGCGMDQGTIAQIFEPFFTTKEIGQGTGLGLSTVFGIVKQNRGFINVYSEPGKGTSFSIYLARHLGEVAETSAGSKPKASAGGHETVLLVEDEPALLSMTKGLLARLGYTVLAACTPADAIRLATEHASHIDLLMTDVIMPVMNGQDLAESLQVHIPNLRILFMSGYTANVIARHGVLEPDVSFIQKPFSRSELALSVRRALDRASITV